MAANDFSMAKLNDAQQVQTSWLDFELCSSDWLRIFIQPIRDKEHTRILR